MLNLETLTPTASEDGAVNISPSRVTIRTGGSISGHVEKLRSFNYFIMQDPETALTLSVIANASETSAPVPPGEFETRTYSFPSAYSGALTIRFTVHSGFGLVELSSFVVD